MASLYRTGTESHFLSAFRLSLLSLAIASGGAMAMAQDQTEGEDDSVAISCEDGTELSAVFDEKTAAITLADGTVLTLPMRDSKDSFSYSDGKYTLSGDEEGARWTVGKKAPVACQFEGDSGPTVFDAPLTVDASPLKSDEANPDIQPQINCYRFTAFSIKEVDLGEKGAQSLAIAPADAACSDTAAKNEMPVKDESAGYFLGAKNNLVFFQAADGVNGGLPFVVYDSKTGQRLFEDNFEGSDFQSLEVDGVNVKMAYRRVYSADCSLFKDGGNCATNVKAATGLGEVAALPECGPAYEEEKKRTPEYAAEVEDLPSVVSYDAELSYDGSKVSIRPLAGEAECRVPD